MEKEKLNKIHDRLTENKENVLQSFRKNVDICMDATGLTLKEVAELADLPYGTFNTFLYGNSEDCKLSTAIKLANVFGLSIDEIVGAGTVNPITKESLAICRDLPEHALYLVRYFIRHQKELYGKIDNPTGTISMMKPPFVGGRLHTTNVYEPLNISHLPESARGAAYVGLEIPCEYYAPYYFPGEILLIAADREGTSGERCVVTHQGRIFIVTKRSYIEKGVKKWKYVALKNEKIEMPESAIDDKVGYIVGFLNPDKSWGVR